MNMTTTNVVSSTEKMSTTEPPSQLQADLDPVKLKYVPLPTPIPPQDNAVIKTTASEDMRPPCRRCLLDAEPGEAINLIAYDPFSPKSASPYRGKSPIFVHASDCAPFDGSVLPERQLGRLMSLRAYNEKDMLVGCEVVEGRDLERVAGVMLADEKAKYINVHNAKPGCFAVQLERL